MSGIEDIKKKAKLSMDEMYEDTSGKPANQKDGKPDNQPGNQPDSHPTSKVDSHKTIHKENHPTEQPPIQPANQLSTNPFSQESNQLGNQKGGIPSKQAPSPKPNNFKMTFNLTEDIFKAFNDLYAKRMIEGRKTEKSDMICEAIQYLLKMEDELKS